MNINTVISRGTKRQQMAIRAIMSADSEGGRPVWETIRVQVRCPFTSLGAHNNQVKRLY